MVTKQIIDGIEGFRSLVGQTIGPSDPVAVTQDRIEAFCHAVDNDEWIHFDEQKCIEAGYGTTIAPGMLTQAYFSKLWFSLVDIRNIERMLFLGSDRVRLLAPLKKGQLFTMSAKIASVEDKENGVAVHLECTWNVVGQDKPVTVATFVIRYMNN